MRTICYLFLLTFSLTSVMSRPFTVQDLVSLERIGEPVPNKSGSKALFTRWKYDIDLNKSAQSIWVANLASSNTSSITNSSFGVTDSDPVWIDESTIAYISTKSGSSQVWVSDVSGSGLTYQLTNLPLSVSNLKIFQTSTLVKMMSFTTRVYKDLSIYDTHTKDQEIVKNPSSALVYDNLYFRHWNAFNDHKYNHIFVVPLTLSNGRYSLNGEPKDLMFGLELESPVLPFGGNSDFNFSPDGLEMAFVSYKPGVDVAWGTNMDIYLVPVSGSSQPISITPENPAQDSYPVYSPDGNSIAYLSMKVPQYEADRRRVIIYDRKTKTKRTLTESWDSSPESIVWSLDSRLIYVTSQDVAKEKLFEINISSGYIRTLVPIGYTSGVKVTQSGLVFNHNSQMRPNEIFTYSNSNLKQITFVNKEYLDQIEMNIPEEFWFEGTLGDRVHGWLIKPPGFDETKKYPIAFLIHGGPQSAWLDNFSFRWNPQVFAGDGFVVIAIDPHGSTSYGQEFCDAINGEWGSYPYEDLMMGLDHVIKTYKFVDGNKVAGLGASYGGYMVNWINGHTDRFSCLVNHCGLFDTETMYYTTEELFFPEYDFRGTPWNSALYEKWNPSNFVQEMKTPTLVIHGALDYRVVDGHGFSTFSALQRQGVKSRLLYFPDEGHWVQKPANLIKWYFEVLTWISNGTKQ